MTCIYVCMFVYVYVHAYVRTYVCMYVCVALKSSRLTGTTDSLNLKQFVQKKSNICLRTFESNTFELVIHFPWPPPSPVNPQPRMEEFHLHPPWVDSGNCDWLSSPIRATVYFVFETNSAK